MVKDEIPSTYSVGPLSSDNEMHDELNLLNLSQVQNVSYAIQISTI